MTLNVINTIPHLKGLVPFMSIQKHLTTEKMNVTSKKQVGNFSVKGTKTHSKSTRIWKA